MSEQEITAGTETSVAELEAKAEINERIGYPIHGDTCRRAARTIQRLEARIAELSETKTFCGQYAADAELGSLVRRIREHPEGKRRCLVKFEGDNAGGPGTQVALTNSGMRLLLSRLDTLATRRAAEEGERGPSGVKKCGCRCSECGGVR